MQKTFPTVQAIRSGGGLFLMIDDRTITKQGDEDTIRTLYNAVIRYQQNPNDETYAAFIDQIEPARRALESGEFEIDDLGRVFLAGSKVPVPHTLSKMVLRYLEAGLPITPLANFWRLSLLNPNEEARDAFFDYVNTFNVTVTRSGEVVLYKAVTHKGDPPDFSKDLQAFVARAMTAVQRTTKSLSQFVVYRNDGPEAVMPDGQMVDEGALFLGTYATSGQATRLGSLSALASRLASLKTEVRYTDKHTKTMDIQLGVPAWKDRSECDPNMNKDCSYGLHVGAFQYVRSFGSCTYDTILACLVNPMNVVAVPSYDHSKMRVCEYFPYSIMEREEDGTWQEIDSPYFEAAYAPYLKHSILRQLEAMEGDSAHLTGDAFRVKQDEIGVVRQTLSSLGLESVEAFPPPKAAQAPNDADQSTAPEYPEDVYDEDEDEDGYWEPADDVDLLDLEEPIKVRPRSVTTVSDNLRARGFSRDEISEVIDAGEMSVRAYGPSWASVRLPSGSEVTLRRDLLDVWVEE